MPQDAPTLGGDQRQLRCDQGMKRNTPDVYRSYYAVTNHMIAVGASCEGLGLSGTWISFNLSFVLYALPSDLHILGALLEKD